MIPLFQKQTIINHNPAEGVYGDCFRASIASLLCLPINEVPHFCDGVDKDDTAWFDRVNSWLGARGLAYVEFTGGEGWEDTFRRLDCYHTIAGPSPRHANTLHSVIGRNGKIVFDPHPSDAGLAASDEPYIYGLLVLTNAPLFAIDQSERRETKVASA